MENVIWITLIVGNLLIYEIQVVLIILKHVVT